jgi:hypothetical protein
MVIIGFLSFSGITDPSLWIKRRYTVKEGQPGQVLLGTVGKKEEKLISTC